MDGGTVEGRMQGLIEQIADDIKRCANICDTWSKMRLLAWVLNVPFWEGTFVDFVNLFAQQRTDLEVAMSMHTARGVDEVSEKRHHSMQLMEERCVHCGARTETWLILVVCQNRTSHWIPADIRSARSEDSA